MRVGMTIDETRVRVPTPCTVPASPLVMPNAWDAGSAKLFASLGFAADRHDQLGLRRDARPAPTAAVTREEAIAHTAALAAATPLPVNADLEDCFADDPAGVAATITGRGRRPARPARRSRTSRATPPARSTTSGWPPTGSPRPSRRHGPRGARR